MKCELCGGGTQLCCIAWFFPSLSQCDRIVALAYGFLCLALPHALAFANSNCSNEGKFFLELHS